jgi:ribosomal protein S12 methylthiotransferase accessory factor
MPEERPVIRPDQWAVAVGPGRIAVISEEEQELLEGENLPELLEEPDTAGMSWPEACWWYGAGATPSDAAHRLSSGRVEILNLAPTGAENLREALHAFGIQEAPGGFRVVVAGDYLDGRIAEANPSGTPWTIFKPVGRQLLFGPVFVPGRTACWECLAHRQRQNRWLETALGLDPQLSSPSRSALPVTVALAGTWMATAVAQWLVLGTSVLEDFVISLDTRDFQIRRHKVTRRPQCPHCGPSDFAAALLEDHVSRISGVVSDPQPWRAAAAAPVIVCRAKASPPLAALSGTVIARPETCVGKGRTWEQAKSSCVAESLERYCSCRHGDEPLRRAAIAELNGEAEHPHGLLLYSDTQYRNRATWNQQHGDPHRIPEPFDPNLPIEWAAAWSLTHRRRRYLPAAWCYLRHEAPFCLADSNGCAAGRGIEEATLAGFLELVERDAAAIWWYNRVRRPGVRLETFDEPFFLQVRRDLARRGRTLEVLDLTSDAGLPVFAALSWNELGGEVAFGLGCHLVAREGITRAICELWQVLTWFDSREVTAEVQRWIETVTIEDQPHLAPFDAPTRSAVDYPRIVTGDAGEDLDFAVNRARALGWEMLVLDVTRADIGVAVVRVTVPGLRHFWPRFAPGRLYDVPVQLGWLAQPLNEADLNPIPCWL